MVYQLVPIGTYWLDCWETSGTSPALSSLIAVRIDVLFNKYTTATPPFLVGSLFFFVLPSCWQSICCFAFMHVTLTEYFQSTIRCPCQPVHLGAPCTDDCSNSGRFSWGEQRSRCLRVRLSRLTLLRQRGQTCIWFLFFTCPTTRSHLSSEVKESSAKRKCVKGRPAGAQSICVPLARHSSCGITLVGVTAAYHQGFSLLCIQSRCCWECLQSTPLCSKWDGGRWNVCAGWLWLELR